MALNNKSLSDLAVRQGQMGDGSSPSSLSRTGIRRLLRGCRLPDAILHGKRSFRPRSRAVRCFATRGFRVRLFSSLQLVVAPPACKPGQDTPADLCFASSPLAPGQPSLLTMRSPEATGLASSLSSCVLSHSPAVSFLTSPALGSFSRNLPSSRGLPDAHSLFVRLSAFFFGRSLILLIQTRQSRPHRADTQ